MDAPLEDHGASPAVGNSISPKKSGRRSAQKRVVSVPVPEVEGTRQKAGGGETSPPSDSWTWRKYGQKPIKGSPYPRGYYRCSSSKGCPARKQVERSRTDPTVFIVTYSFEHNHSWPLPRNHHRHHHHSSSVMASSHEPKPDAEPSPSELASDPEEKFSELIVEETSLMIPDDFRWPSASSASAIDDGILYGTLCGGLTTVDDCEKFSSSGSGVAMDEEEDALFAGLGELPECSVVFQRGFLDRPMRGGDEAKRCSMEADETASAATASWCHGTGL